MSEWHNLQSTATLENVINYQGGKSAVYHRSGKAGCRIFPRIALVPRHVERDGTATCLSMDLMVYRQFIQRLYKSIMDLLI